MSSPPAPLSHKGFYHRGMALNFVTFNQDHSVLGVGTSKGFRQYATEPFSKSYEGHEGDVAIMEMLFSTSLVALVLSPRVLRIQNTKRQSIICELTFPQKILTVKMNRKRLVVVLEDAMYLYDISNMKMLHTIETSPNPHAICALSPSSENNYLIYPKPQKKSQTAFNPPMHAPPQSHVAPMKGDLIFYDATSLSYANVVEAHQTSLSCVSLNNEGTLVATASEKGTIIRVFSVPDGQKLFQFRRGSIPARIYSMSFNVTSTLLCVSSATETVHIFRLISQNKNPEADNSRGSSPVEGRPPSSSSRDRSISPSSEDPRDSNFEVTAEGERKPINPTWQTMLRRTSQSLGKNVVAAVGGYMPKAVTEIWEPARDFAWVKVPRAATGANTGPLKSVVAMSSNHPQVMVATSEGRLYVFSIDLEKGGEGVLLDERSLLEERRLGVDD